MVEATAEVVIYLAMVFAIALSLVVVPWIVFLILRERRERRALLEEYRCRSAARRARYVAEAEAAHEWSPRPATPRRKRRRATQRHALSRSLQRHA